MFQSEMIIKTNGEYFSINKKVLLQLQILAYRLIVPFLFF
jgi:hypothetical protein